MKTVSIKAGGGGISALGIVGIIFVLAKIFAIAPIATWSWWLVTLPFWGFPALALCVIFIWLAGSVVIATIAAFK